MTQAQRQAHTALSIAATRIGRNNFKLGIYRPTYRRGRLVQGYRITAEHAQLIDAMPAVLSGAMTPDEAMALLWQHDTMKQRTEGK